MLISGLLAHRGSELLAREQASFYLRDAQNGMVEMGQLLQQLASAGQPGISQQCNRLLQLNAQIGDVLQQVQKCLQ